MSSCNFSRISSARYWSTIIEFKYFDIKNAADRFVVVGKYDEQWKRRRSEIYKHSIQRPFGPLDCFVNPGNDVESPWHFA